MWVVSRPKEASYFYRALVHINVLTFLAGAVCAAYISGHAYYGNVRGSRQRLHDLILTYIVI